MGLSVSSKTGLIKSLSLFAHCSKSDLALVARISDEIDLPAGRTIITEGERGREFFVLVNGEVEVRRKGRKLRTLGPGAMLGELALVSNIPRTATVTTLTPVALLVITERAFRSLLALNPPLQAKVLQSVADRLAPLVD